MLALSYRRARVLLPQTTPVMGTGVRVARGLKIYVTYWEFSSIDCHWACQACVRGGAVRVGALACACARGGARDKRLHGAQVAAVAVSLVLPLTRSTPR